MARQFKGAAKGRGFNPIPISSANITRMREENERIIRGLQERRESQRNNEERQLQAMQSDAAYYERVRERDFKITDKNLSNEALQVQYDAEAEANRLEQKSAAVTAVFSAVAAFSETASKLAKQAKDDRNKEQRAKGQELAQRNDFLTFSQLKFDKGLDAEAAGRLILASTIDQLRESGATEEQLQRAQAIGIEGSLALFQAKAKLTTKAEWPKFLADYVKENNIDLSLSDDTKAWYTDAWSSFEEKNGWSELGTELLSEALKEKTTHNQTFQSGVSAMNAENDKNQNINNLTTIALGNWDVEAPGVFKEVTTALGGNKKAAHEWVVQSFDSMDANGKFYLEEDQLYTFSVMPDGQPYYIPPNESVTIGNKTWKTGSHQNRGVEILNKRATKRRKWNTGVATDDRHSYQEESKAWLRHIVIDGNNTPEDIAAAVESFKDNVQGIPDWLRKLKNAGDSSQGSYNSNLITQAKDLEARGMLYQDIIDKVNERDPKTAKELQASYEKQDPFMLDDMYKKNFNSIEKLPLKQDIGGNYPEPNADANRDTAALQDAYEQLVKRAVADGASIKDAAYTGLKTIENGFNDENSPFYRIFNPNTAQYEFKNLYTKTPREIAESLDQADQQFLKNLDAGHNKTQLKKAMFAQPDIVLTDAQYEQQIVDMESPGFTFHPRIDMLVQSGAVNSHMAALALVGAAKKRPPIIPPPSLQVVSEYPPGSNKLLFKWGPRSSNIEARAHGAGLQAQAPEAGLALVPQTIIPNLRELYRTSAERHGVSPAENAAIGEVETAHGLGYPDPKTKRSYIGGRKAAFGPMQILPGAHPEFFEKHNGNPSDEAVIDYGTGYYAGLKREFNGDHIAAAMSYNGGKGHYLIWRNETVPDWVKDDKDLLEWNRIVDQMTSYGKKFAKAYYKHSGDASLLQNPLLLRN